MPEPTASAVDATGRYAWPAGRRLARDLSAVVDCRDRVICDLGCGTGVVGRAALQAGARRVAFLDGAADALALVRQALADEPRADYHLHQWGDAPPGGPYGLILGGDILYREAYFPQLLASIALGLAPAGQCLLSDPRSRLEEELPLLAAAAGLDWASVRRNDFTLVTVRRSGDVRPAAQP